VTVASDSSGLSYFNSKGHRFAPCDRSATVAGGHIILKDRNDETTLPVPLPRESLDQPGDPVALSPVDWRSMFVPGVPPVTPSDAYGAVLLYPDDESEIGECSAQPFVADYIQDIGEQDREIGAVLSQAQRVVIDNGDAVVATCMTFDRPRDYTVLVRHPAFAQKQAQRLWNICAELQRWDWLSHIRFVSHDREVAYAYDVAYCWVPYDNGNLSLDLAKHMERIGLMLHAGGTAFVVGPAELGQYGESRGLRVCWKEPVEQLPTFRIHRTILPRARLKAGLTLFHLKKV
jgi:hypothetical protein